MSRTLLLASTALLGPPPALAQAPDARPQGGAVVAGQASIVQTPGRTQVHQAGNRAVIEWRGFDIGANHHVDIRQPGAGAWSLQRVTGGDPSAIAGRLTSNGGVAITNPAGIVFHNGAQVDVAGLIATTASTTNANFMAGRMVFDGAPPPGGRRDARVENRGTITVRDRGLAALVGPVAANSGTINARLGRVAVAGAEAFALDLAGDGLLALDVTREVASTPGGATALATNSGTIAAEGGHVLLTAEAASGVLETLVSAGGRVAAAEIVANAPGGGVLVPAGAVLDASAPGGGGRVIVGAGAGSRIGAPAALSARTTVARGATLRADGAQGAGGTVIVHAAGRTAMHGEASARGTPGGRIEVSSRHALALDGRLDAGRDGRVLLDPQSLHIVRTLSGSSEPAEVTAATVNTTPGHLVLQAERSIRVRADVDRDAGPLTLETTNAAAAAGDGIAIARPLAVVGDLRLLSAGNITQAPSGARIAAGTLFAESRAGAVRLEAAENAILALDGGRAATRFDLANSASFSVDGAIAAPAIRLATPGTLALYAPVVAGGTLALTAPGGIAQRGASGGIAAGTLTLEAPFGPIALTAPGNRIAALGDVTAPHGLALRNETSLRIGGVVDAAGAAVALRAETGDLTQGAAGARLVAGSLRAEAPGGSVLLDAPGNAIARIAGMARDDFTLAAGGALLLEDRIAAARVTLTAAGDLAQVTDALLVTADLRVRAIGGRVLLEDPLNAVAALGASVADAGFALATAGTLRLTGRLAAPEIALTPAGSLIQAPGGFIETGSLRIGALTGAVALAGAGNRIGALGPASAAQGFALATGGALAVTGALDAGGTLRITADQLRLAAPIAAPDIVLRALAGGIVQEVGGLVAATLRAEATDGVNLAAAGNAIAALSGRAGALFRVATAGPLAPDDIAAAEVALRAGGGIVQPAAGLGIVADLLHAEAGAAVNLTAGTNAIRELGRIAAPAGLALRSTASLRLTEPFSVPAAEIATAGDLSQTAFAGLGAGTLRLTTGGDATLADSGNAIGRLLSAEIGGGLRLSTADALTLEGPLRAGGAVTLIAGGSLAQPAGFIAAPSLTARSTFGNVTLDGANLLGAVGGGAAGVWRLRHAGTNDLRLAGLIFAPEVALILAGGLDEAGGSLRAEVLGLDVAGAAVLEGPGHRVAALSGRAGALRLAAGGPLDITGALEVGDALALAADRIGLLAPVAAARALLVALSGDVAQAAGGAGLTLPGGLEVHAAGAVALAGAGNQVARLARGSAAGDFALASGGALTVAGGVGGETVVLRASGPLRLDGAAFQAGRAVLLAAPAGIEAGAPSRLEPLDPARLPVLLLDTRRATGLVTIPAFVQPDTPGLPPAAQPTQLVQFGPASGATAGGAAFDVTAGASPVFLLLDAGPSVGALEAGRLGVLGQGGGAFLVGVIGGVGGEEAAALIAINASDAAYRFNNCPMGAANCGQTPPPGPDPFPPTLLPSDPDLPPGTLPDMPVPPVAAAPVVLVVPVRVDLFDLACAGASHDLLACTGRPSPWRAAQPSLPPASLLPAPLAGALE